MFRVGTLVTWTSQAAGIVRTKKGTIVEIVPRGKRPTRVDSAGMGRNHESYVVRASPDGGKTWRRYWPKVKLLCVAAVNQPIENKLREMLNTVGAATNAHITTDLQFTVEDEVHYAIDDELVEVYDPIEETIADE